MNTKTKAIILFCIANLLVVVMWVIVFGRARSASVSYVTESALLATENSKEAYLAAGTKDLRETTAARARLEALFVKEGEEITFLERVEGLARTAGVELKVVDFSRQGPVLRLILESKGSFGASYYFVRLVEALPLALALDSMRLEERRGEGDSRFWQGSYGMTLYSYLGKEVQ